MVAVNGTIIAEEWKKRGRLGSSHVKEGGLGRVDFVILVALFYLDWDLCWDLFYSILSDALYALIYIFIYQASESAGERVFSWLEIIKGETV